MHAFTYLHILGASIALVAGYAALFAPKGQWLHRHAGLLFVYAMVAMGIGAAVAGYAHDRESWSGGITAAYFAITAATTVRRGPQDRNLPFDATLLLIPVGFGVARLVAGVQVASLPGARTPEGVPAALVLLSAVLLLFAAAGDIRVLRHGPLRGNQRLKRHLWRMGYAMFSATGAFFLGQPQFVPSLLSAWPVRTTLAVLPLVVMFFWLWRVRKRRNRASATVPIQMSARTAATVIVMAATFSGTLGAEPATPAPTLLAQTRLAVSAGDYDAAIRQMERALEQDEANPEYHYWLGRALLEGAPQASKFRMIGLARRAKKEWERTVVLDPTHVGARAGLAEFYLMAPGVMGGSKTKAREQAAEVAKLDPMRGALTRAVIARHEKDWAGEEQAYRQGIAAAADSLSAYVAFADAYVHTGRIDEAFAVIARYAERFPQDPWVSYQRGRLAGNSGQQLEAGEKALQAFLASPPADLAAPGRSRAYYWLGKIAQRRNDKAGAGERYRTAIEINLTNHLAKRALEELKQ